MGKKTWKLWSCGVCFLLFCEGLQKYVQTVSLMKSRIWNPTNVPLGVYRFCCMPAVYHGISILVTHRWLVVGSTWPSDTAQPVIVTSWSSVPFLFHWTGLLAHCKWFTVHLLLNYLEANLYCRNFEWQIKHQFSVFFSSSKSSRVVHRITLTWRDHHRTDILGHLPQFQI